jgi:Zinc-finger associated domain (zf-AD)
MSSNLVNSCRCCLSSDEDGLLAMYDSSLFDESDKPDQNLKLIDSYFELCVDSVNATLGPFNICFFCRLTLQTFTTFREQCLKNNELFQNNTVKTETAEIPNFNVIVNERKVSTEVSTQHPVTEQARRISSKNKTETNDVRKLEPPSEDEDDIPLARRIYTKNKTETPTALNKTTSNANSFIKSEPPPEDEDDIPLARRMCLRNKTETSNFDKTTSKTNGRKSEPPSEDEDDIPLARRICLRNKTETLTLTLCGSKAKHV